MYWGPGSDADGWRMTKHTSAVSGSSKSWAYADAIAAYGGFSLRGRSLESSGYSLIVYFSRTTSYALSARHVAELMQITLTCVKRSGCSASFDILQNFFVPQPSPSVR